MLEQVIIAHGAPTLARLKVGSLFPAPCADTSALMSEIGRLNETLIPRGVHLIMLRRANGRPLMYLYREQALRDTLLHPDVQALLTAYGYHVFTVDAALDTLRTRLTSSCEFPHEIGVFLGYPLEDVVGFIRNKGRNCLCSGCWKAYSDECGAQRTFARLSKCRAVYARCFAEGFSLSRLTVRA